MYDGFERINVNGAYQEKIAKKIEESRLFNCNSAQIQFSWSRFLSILETHELRMLQHSSPASPPNARYLEHSGFLFHYLDGMRRFCVPILQRPRSVRVLSMLSWNVHFWAIPQPPSQSRHPWFSRMLIFKRVIRRVFLLSKIAKCQTPAIPLYVSKSLDILVKRYGTQSGIAGFSHFAIFWGFLGFRSCHAIFYT